MFKLRLMPKAESDLIGVWVCTCEELGVEQADKYLDQLKAGMKQLVSHPLLGTNYAHVFPGYHRRHLEHHAVFYQVLAAEVLVVRVLHEDMDAPQRLLEYGS